MRRIIAQGGRRMGKSTISLEHAILRQQTEAMQKSIDKMIIDELRWTTLTKYYIRKSWHDRNGRKMHRIDAMDEVREWLETEHSQYGVSNPDWWKFENKINITDKLLTLLVLRFAE